MTRGSMGLLCEQEPRVAKMFGQTEGNRQISRYLAVFWHELDQGAGIRPEEEQINRQKADKSAEKMQKGF